MATQLDPHGQPVKPLPESRALGGEDRDLMNGSLSALVLVIVTGFSTVDAQAPGIQPLTDDRLREAIAIAEGGKSGPVIAATMPQVLLYEVYGQRSFTDKKLMARTDALMKGPFEIRVLSPYARAVEAVSEARRKFTDRPPLDVATLNSEQVVVVVKPGKTFPPSTIENVVIRRGGQIIKPTATKLTPVTLQNALGASATAQEGRFSFDFAAFEPSQPITFVFVATSGNFEWTMEPPELFLAQMKVDVPNQPPC